MSTSRSSLDERGQATAEYAVGTIGAACIGCVVWQLFGEDSTGWFQAVFDQLRDIGERLRLRSAS